MRRIGFNHFRIVDADADFFGSLLVENGVITRITPNAGGLTGDIVIDGGAFGPGAVLMPAFIDLHAHFRDPGFTAETSLPSEMSFPAEMLESAALAAAAGGFVTVVCMANTRPVIDTAAKARAMKQRSDAFGVIDLYPALSLTKNMEGRELSGIPELPAAGFRPRLLSEDGKDVAGDELFLAAMAEARRLGVPVSCHCDFGGAEAEAAKAAGRPRPEWSRIEENNAVRRAIALGRRAGCHIHIAHVSTQEAVAMIRDAKTAAAGSGCTLTCEATPHHLAATEADARRLGVESFGRVNPPLRTEADRRAIAAAALDGAIDAIATDHAPHREADKAAGSPGFTGLETAFAACYTTLQPAAGLRRLSALMSANPARIIALDADRGKIAAGLRADLVIVDTTAAWNVDPRRFRSRGRCTPFAGTTLQGKVLMTCNNGRIVFDGRQYD